MKNKKNPKNNLVKTTICIVVGILSVYLIMSSLNITLRTNKTVLSYQEDADISYKVYLKENSDFTDSYLKEGESYLAHLIDDIVTTFNYNFIADEKFNFTYDYRIYAELKAYDKSDQNRERIVWNKNYELVPKTSKKLTSSNGYKINEALAIKYDTYNQIIADFATNNNVELNSYLTVILETNVSGIYEEHNEEINNSSTIEMEIPINEGTIEIITKDDINNENELKGDENINFSNPAMTIIGVLLLVGSIVILIFDGYKAYKMNEQQTKHHEEIETIIKKYNKIMLRTNKLPVLKNKRVIEIANLADLIELEKELKTGILVYEKTKASETWFVIIHQNEAWIYIRKV